MIRLITGLGNPGPEYEATRHNAGFWFVDEVARTLKVTLSPERSYFGLAARASTVAGAVWLLQPMTYMNLSGKSVAALARFFKIAPDEILVVHDELDLMPGQSKLKIGGSHAGHNGLKDIQAQLGSADFWRLRLGVGHPGVKAEVINYVLRKPPAAEREAIDDAITRSLGALDSAAVRRDGAGADEDSRAPGETTQTAAGDRSPAPTTRPEGVSPMKTLCALALSISFAATAPCDAATVYRCGPQGNVYSDAPCAQGRIVDTADERSDEQRAQAIRVAALDKRFAADMQRERLQLAAARPPAAGALSARPVPAPAALPRSNARSHKRHIASKASATSGDFVAIAPRR